MLQGACITEDMCKSIGCDSYGELLVNYKIESCEVKCCAKDGCNNPVNFMPGFSVELDPSKAKPGVPTCSFFAVNKYFPYYYNFNTTIL